MSDQGKRATSERFIMKVTCITVLVVWGWKNFTGNPAPKELLDLPSGVLALFLGAMGLSSIPEAVNALREFARKDKSNDPPP